MKRRGSMKQWLLASALALLALNAAAQIQAGREYQRIDPQRPAAADARIEVIEFFYYGCPVCYETEPFLSRWLRTAPDYVAMRRVPALSSEAWEPLAKLYYTLETLGQVERLHWPVYDNIHFEDVRLGDPKLMVDWAARNGIDREKFVQTYESPAVADKVTQARALLKSYSVGAVPTFIVDGKFITSARLAGGTSQVVEVLDRLVKLAREERLR
ncbi:MAG TPA: thiol:disulfide interchange protein DsbA/DsbL [Burkholderiales bacterium]|nr:thiol:disulfide interchange protein DsbA/DsbL [Burkholderiales bacterium]